MKMAQILNIVVLIGLLSSMHNSCASFAWQEDRKLMERAMFIEQSGMSEDKLRSMLQQFFAGFSPEDYYTYADIRNATIPVIEPNKPITQLLGSLATSYALLSSDNYYSVAHGRSYRTD